MQMTRVLVALAAMLVVVGALGQNYPDRPIHLVSPFPPGGGGDVMARLIGDAVSRRVGQPVVVENKPGADQIIGTQFVAQSRPDGYTLLLTGYTGMMHMAYERPLPYNAFTDIVPVTLVANVPVMLVANVKLGVKSVQELMVLAKSRPGQLKVGHIGTGGVQFMCFKLIEQTSGVDFLEVPYKGTAPAVSALLGGEVDLIFTSVGQGMELAAAGRVVALGVSSSSPSPAAPNVPTLAQAGIPGFDLVARFYLYTPKGTPALVVSQLNREMRAVLADKSVSGKLEAAGFEIASSSSDEAIAQHRAYYEIARRIIKKANLRWTE